VSNQFSKRLSPTSIIHTQTVIYLSQCFLISVLMLLICFYCFLQLALSLSHFKASGVNTDKSLTAHSALMSQPHKLREFMHTN